MISSGPELLHAYPFYTTYFAIPPSPQRGLLQNAENMIPLFLNGDDLDGGEADG
ncbi:UNVERIFIED_ORG: hypothetical protein GGE44_005821, partial [Rhizobium esperanzae]